MSGLPYSVKSPCCIAKSRTLVRQSRSSEWREIDRRLAPLWGIFAAKLKEQLTLRKTPKAHALFQPLDFRTQVLDVFDRRNGIGKSVFRFAPVGDDDMYCISLDVSVPNMSVDVLQQLVGDASLRLLAVSKNRESSPFFSCDGCPPFVATAGNLERRFAAL